MCLLLMWVANHICDAFVEDDMPSSDVTQCVVWRAFCFRRDSQLTCVLCLFKFHIRIW